MQKKVKKAAEKKVVQKKVTATPKKKVETKKAAPKKEITPKKKLNKAVEKKVVQKKITATPKKKVVVKKAAVKKAAPAKKVVAKKIAPKKVAAPKKIVKKVAVKKAVIAPKKKVETKKITPKKVATPVKKTVKAAPAKAVIKKVTPAPKIKVAFKTITPIKTLIKPAIKKIVEKPVEVIKPEVSTKNRYSDEELQEFKEIILKKLEEAKRDLEILTEAYSNSAGQDINDTSPTFKILEEGSQVLSKEENSQLAMRQTKFITNLENALIRIENKSYGICRVTGKLISKERLRIVPHATLSMEAKLQQGKQR